MQYFNFSRGSQLARNWYDFGWNNIVETGLFVYPNLFPAGYFIVGNIGYVYLPRDGSAINDTGNHSLTLPKHSISSVFKATQRLGR